MLVGTLEMVELLHPVALWHVHNLHAAAVLAGGRRQFRSVREKPIASRRAMNSRLMHSSPLHGPVTLTVIFALAIVHRNTGNVRTAAPRATTTTDQPSRYYRAPPRLTRLAALFADARTE